MKKNIFKEVGEEWEDYFGTSVDKLDNEKFKIEEKYNPNELLECYEKWKGELYNNFNQSYPIAKKLLKKYKIPFLSEDEINEFLDAGNIKNNEPIGGGVFLSAMINELHKNKEIHLQPNNGYYIGYHNKDKKIVVEGDCKGGVGVYMKGGEVIVKGNCGYWIGEYMEGGIIKIYGDFNPKEQISAIAKGGEIYHKKELVWKDGEGK